MAFVEGCNLHQFLQKEGRLSADRIATIGEQSCRTLEAARVEGVVHRDLKPQNILVDEAGQIYVSDSGLAKSFESSASGMTRIWRLKAELYIFARPRERRGEAIF